MTSANFLVLVALIGELGFMAISILAKRLRTNGVGSRSILAVYGLTLPVWIAAVAYFVSTGQMNWPWPYLVCLLLWLGTCYFLNLGTIYISAFQSLSEGTGYRFGFSAMIALLADLFIFGTEFHPAVIVAISLLFAGGILLHMNRVKQDFQSTKLVPLHLKLGFVLLVSLAEVSTYALFKYAATMQDTIYAHNAVFQSMLFLMFLVIGGKVMVRDCKQGYFPVPYMIALCGFLIIAASADAVALAGLPVTLFIMFSLIRTACFAVHDIKTKEIALNATSIAAIALIAAGIASTVLIRGF